MFLTIFLNLICVNQRDQRDNMRKKLPQISQIDAEALFFIKMHLPDIFPDSRRKEI
jgi:hypothetical protein